MEGNPITNASERRSYHRATKSATYAFLASLPLLIIYEIAIVWVGRGVRVGADVWTKRLLESLGQTGWTAVAVTTLIIGIIVFWLEKDRRPPIFGKYFGWLFVESLAYAIVLAFIVSSIVGAIFLMFPVGQVTALPLSTKLALSIGAGLYEELIFRVVLVGGLFLIFQKLLTKRKTAYILAALLGAIIFSWVHYTGPFGDPFRMDSFTFRFLFGLALNGVFLWRGFAAAAWTHALYDVLVVTRLL